MLPKRNLSEDKVSLEINLEKLFGQKVNDSALRRAIAERAIEIILDRTADGHGVDGKGSLVKFPGYSKAYKNSLEFKGFDKDGKVNMKLSGSMLSTLDLLDESGSVIEIGIEDDAESPKAFNHITGDTLPKRPFLGLMAADLDKIKDEFADELKSDEPLTAKQIFERSNLSKLIKIVTRKKGNLKVDNDI